MDRNNENFLLWEFTSIFYANFVNKFSFVLSTNMQWRCKPPIKPKLACYNNWRNGEEGGRGKTRGGTTSCFNTSFHFLTNHAGYKRPTPVLLLSGAYIFIEASQRKRGEKARLLSGWIEPNETVCVQFWYHMHGADIGNLSVYLKTNQSEYLVWRLSGDKGNRWRFGQTALSSPSFYKVSFSVNESLTDSMKISLCSQPSRYSYI